jgi:DNA-binding transcriptional LysR family regulator
MDWDSTRIFLSVARLGQFLAASRQLKLDHATVSRRIGQLEASLGVRLFERRTYGSVLTPAGERFLVAAERIEAEILRAEAELKSVDLEASGTVRIGAPDGFGTLFLAPRLGALAARHPRLTIQLVPLPRTFSLSKREADIAIVVDRPEGGRLAMRKLTDYRLSFFAARSYLSDHPAPRTREDLKSHALVTYVQDLQYAGALNYFPEAFEPEFRRFECASIVAQLEAVRSGAGIGILHDYAAHTDSDLVGVLPDLFFERTYWIVTHEDTRHIARVRAVHDFICDAVETNLAIFR